MFCFIFQVHRPSMWIMNKHVQLIKGKKEEKVLFLHSFCVAYEARMTHRDNVSGGGGGIRCVTLYVSKQLLMKGCILQKCEL